MLQSLLDTTRQDETMAIITGTPGNDTLTGTAASDEIRGGGGDDIINGGGGADQLFGEDGNDVIRVQPETSGSATTSVNGGAGVDTLVIVGSSMSGASVNLQNGQAFTNTTSVTVTGIENVTLEGASGTFPFTGFAIGDGGANVLTAGSQVFGQFSGGGGDDVLNASNLGGNYAGDAGNDRLNGGAGGDTLAGGDGDDVANGAAGNDSIDGGIGSDLLNGEAGNDFIDGGLGNDLLNGGAGNDSLQSGGGVDRLFGDDGDDTLSLGSSFGAGPVLTGTTADGGAGRDRLSLFSTATVDLATGVATIGTAQATFTSVEDVTVFTPNTSGLTRILGDAGANTLVFGGPFSGFSSASAELDGRDGDDVLQISGSGTATLRGGAGQDRLIGGNGAESLFGDAGNDLIGGGDGADVIEGGDGDDFAGGESGNDRIGGGAGSDRLFGDFGNDLLGGGIGNDGLFGGEGDDFMGGEDGDDFLDGGGGIDVLFGDAGNDVVIGGLGNDRLFGQDGDDRMDGKAGDDFLSGGAGNDQLEGGSGIDRLSGDDGNDLLIAGPGMGSGAPDLIKPASASNTTRGNAVSLIGSFDLLFNADIQQSTEIPHATVRGTVGAGSVIEEFYSFTTLRSSDIGIFDIDGASFDTVLTIFDANGVKVASNDDAGFPDPGSTSGLDSRVSAFLSVPGTYFVSVRSATGALPQGGTYTLQASVTSAPVTNVASQGSTLEGGAGNDTLQGGAGDDTGFGGADNDRISGGAGADQLFGEAGNDLIGGGIGDDRLFGGAGDDFMGGEDGADLLAGGLGLDVLFGDAGADELQGGEGNDRLFGQDGADVLNGGLEDDLLDGGAGVDTAVFAGARSGYTISTADGVTTVTGRDGTDRLIAIERLQFDDAVVTLSGSPLGDEAEAPLPTAGDAAPLPLPADFII